MEISVSDDDIAYAERVLLPAGESFDAERSRFIRNMATLDLQAVPGSGKTTALLAKLLILDRYLPFEDGSGILVISHTNAAIDEIKGKIGSHCVNLFHYPNFVGTIQAFVDEFLAVPFYTNKYGKAPTRIDDDIYNQKFALPPFGFKGFALQENKNSLRFLMANTKKIRWSFSDGKVLLTDGYCGKEIDFKKPRGNTKPQNYADWSDAEKDRIRQWVGSFKLSIIKSGCLCYDDAYFLARMSLVRNAPVKLLLQKRFAHVFVDEMQDMERHQYELLEDIFYDAGASSATYQRIGDRNQSIFDGRNSAANEYLADRAMLLELNGSYRLSPVLAGVVNVFAINPIRIEGRRKNPDGSDVSINPRLIVYSDSTKGLVIDRFASIIRDLTDSGAIPTNPSNRYKAVAWATKEESGKVRLPDYFPSYSKVELQRRTDHTDLSSHLVAARGDDCSLASVEMAIVNALLRILRLEKAEDLAGKHFVKRTMHEFLGDTNPDYWCEYQSKVYEWCLEVARGNTMAVLKDVRSHLPTFLSIFGRQICNSRDFVHDHANAASGSSSATQKLARNVLVCEGIRVEVATVHRVKGETHTATLYMETFYERGGGGNYESERLAVQFKGQPIDTKVHDLVRQSAKMIYVGFSRPTHLLCFALHESRFAKIEAGINNSVWEVLRL
ncbi:UvrD-helicase domain-containing protein [Pseudomonas sp. MH9.2]|uniref:UvrD-helicase domain-containing protein n=1 Tax=unclassified Pseudomonas TaxID=196821 RepID=UPI002AC95E7B|nr:MULTISPECIES: UvrD-helicase domain-containing protein [unclassified Pseudomonas]MEB0028960.1 UvrD-helicase domain-containing protein [Pseudomonas sp. MH9.2]MEB0120936.1 UvrD-helicase domain-containing protein [Pseudomonas sp. CCI1.2]WPX67803.1 UvrD-helicase domain-containing protein [Pseudomonas sp. MH9.2]